MQLRSGRRLSPPRAPAPGGQRRQRPAPRLPEAGGGGDVEEEDRISSLPDDLLLAVLARLGRTEEAARTSNLARRWRGLWTQLPRLYFDYRIRLDALEAAIAQVNRPALDLVDIWLILRREALGRVRVSSLLRDIAERLAPKKLAITFEGDDDRYEAINLPCFPTTTTIHFYVGGGCLALPQAGCKFEALTTLKLENCSMDLDELLPMCPSLRYLDLTDMLHEVTVRSPWLEKFKVQTTDGFPCNDIDISAPLLKEAAFDIHVEPDFSISFSAPMVKRIHWRCTYEEETSVGLPCMDLSFLDYSLIRGVHQICLDIGYSKYFSDEADWSFAEVIAHQLPLSHMLSVLKLELNVAGHAFAPLLLHLLQTRPVKTLNVELIRARQIGMQCPLNCPCEQANSNWRDENIMLTHLQAVTIAGFEGHDDEVDFLNVLFRCATAFKRMTVKVTSGGYNKIRSICEQYKKGGLWCSGRPHRL